MIHAILLRTLIFWLWCGALSAVLSGVLGFLANGAGVPLADVQQITFSSYLVPGLLMGIVIGVTQLTAAILIRRRNLWAMPSALVAGAGMIVWNFFELAIVRDFSPLHVVFLALGVGEIILVLWASLSAPRVNIGNDVHS